MVDQRGRDYDNHQTMIPTLARLPFWERHAGLIHGYTSRGMGNLSYRTAGKAEAEAGRERLSRELGIDAERMFSVPLGHSNKVAVLRDDTFLRRRDGKGYLRPEVQEIIGWPELTPQIYAEQLKDREHVDGVVFSAPEVYSLIITADCAAVAFFDPVRQVCGNSHIGLVGAVNQLPRAMVAALVESFGSDPSDIEAVIFPCIRQCHYDTSNSRTWQRIKEDVFGAYGRENSFYVSGYFDLPGFIRWQLVEAGVSEKKICDTGLCTVCHADSFFSHVGAGSAEAQAVEGRFGAVIGRTHIKV